MTGVQIFLSANAAMICVQREMGKRIKMTTKGSKNHQGKGFMWTKLKMVIAPMFALIGHWKTVRYTFEYSNVTKFIKFSDEFNLDQQYHQNF